MAANLDWTSVVGQKTVTNGGYVGDLMTTARAHIAEAVRKNEITQAQAGEVYTAMIPAAFQAGLEFILKEQLAEAQIDATVADTLIKQEQSTKDLLVKQEQINASVADTSVKQSQSAADLTIKYQQELAEKIKNGKVTVTYYYEYINSLGQTQTGTPTTDLSTISALNYVITNTVYSDTEGTTPSIYALEMAKLQKEASSIHAQTDILQQKVVGRSQVPVI